MSESSTEMIQLLSFLLIFFVSVVEIHATSREFTFTRVFGDMLNLGGLISVAHGRTSSSCLLRCGKHRDCFQVELIPSNSTSLMQCCMRNFATTLQQVPNKDHEYLQLAGVWNFLEIHVVAHTFGSGETFGSKFTINNRLVQSASRGVNVVTVDFVNGKAGSTSEFDVYQNNAKAISMISYVNQLPKHKLVLIATNDEASRGVDQIGTSAAYATLGAKNAVLRHRDCFCLIGCKACHDDFPVAQVIKTSADAPCECFFRGYVTFDPNTGSAVARGYM